MSTSPRIVPHFILFVAAMCAAPGAGAVVYCVQTTDQLIFALADAESNDVSDRILLGAGPFLSPTEGFKYNPPVSGNGTDITLEGGFGSQCVGPGPKSVIDGKGSSNINALSFIVEDSDVRISNLAITGFENDTTDFASALIIDASYSNITLDGNLFAFNTSNTHSALNITGHSGHVRLLDNVFTGNQTINAVATIQGTPFAPYVQYSCELINNTVAYNHATGNAEMYVADCGDALIANNIFWGNEGVDLSMSGFDQTYRLENNDIESFETAPGLTLEQSGNFSEEPQFEPGLFNFTPAPNSPLVDAGTEVDIDNAEDFRGMKRRSGSAPDVGAIERQTDILRDGFEG